ncbi:MAG TPA: response regulator [Candidatus Dormibacteraeota bacterium]|nr:response regulator [Candidatus Dormibacteraeota bacterium]
MILAARVLLIEDHPDIADLYQLKLQLEGYRVAVARTGDVGLALANSLLPDLILLDLHLPGMDGLDLLARLRAQDDTRGTPVVVITEDENPDLMTAAEELGTSGYMIKARTLPKRLAEVVSAALTQRPRRATPSANRQAS